MNQSGPPRTLRKSKLGLKTTDAEFLYLLATNYIADPGNKNADTWLDEMDTLIADCINREQDDTVLLAIALLRAAQNAFACALVRKIADTESEDLFSMSTDDEDDATQTVLFAIPILIRSETVPFTSVIPPEQDFQALVESFGDMTLFDDSTPALANYLYLPEELDMKWSDRRALADALVESAVEEQYAPIAALAQHESGNESEDESMVDRVSVRYLVGALVCEEDHPVPALTPDDPQIKDRLMSWCDSIGSRLAKAMKKSWPDTQFSVTGIFRFSEGVQRGLSSLNDMLVQQQIGAVLTEKELACDAVKAIVGAYFTSEGKVIARASLVEKTSNVLLGGCDSFTVDAEMTAAAVEALVSQLSTQNIDIDMIVEGEIQPHDACPECGTPLFLVRDPDDPASIGLQHGIDPAADLHVLSGGRILH